MGRGPVHEPGRGDVLRGLASRPPCLPGSAVDPQGCFSSDVAPETGPCAAWRNIGGNVLASVRDSRRPAASGAEAVGELPPSLTSFGLGEAEQRRTCRAAAPHSLGGCRLAVDSDCRTTTGSGLRGVGPSILVAQHIISEQVGRPPQGSASLHRRPVVVRTRARVAGLHRQQELLCASSLRISHG